MEELIARLRALMDGLDAGLAGHRTVDDSIRLRGMHDVLLAMEERCGTIRTAEGRGIVHRNRIEWEARSPESLGALCGVGVRAHFRVYVDSLGEVAVYTGDSHLIAEYTRRGWTWHVPD